MKTPEPGVMIGARYLLIRPLASGGMGSVWIARHQDLDVDVTVKFMEPSLLKNAELRGRFEREAKVVARLRSQHIVQVLDYGVDEQLPYIAMELLHGESLADKLSRERCLSGAETAPILWQICKALRTAHEAGLVHRDLKPGNIFLADKDGEQVVKVLDFGIVKEMSVVDEAKVETATGIAMGSVHYMSPEQIRSSRQVDVRSDLWSVGVILYKMLTGAVPYSGGSTGDVMVRICTEMYAPPSFVVAGLSKAVDAFFGRALTRDPDGRFQSAKEMAVAFVAAMRSSEPVVVNQRADFVRTMPFPRNVMESISAVEFLSGSAVQTSPPTMPIVVVAPNVSETAPGTFQAVTTSQTPRVVIQQRPIPLALRSNRGLVSVIGVGVIVGVIVGVVVFVVDAGFDVSSRKSEIVSGATNGPTTVAAASVMSTASPIPSSSASVAPRSSGAVPAMNPPTNTKPLATTIASVLPRRAPAPQGNPLDRSD